MEPTGTRDPNHQPWALGSKLTDSFHNRLGCVHETRFSPCCPINPRGQLWASRGIRLMVAMQHQVQQPADASASVVADPDCKLENALYFYFLMFSFFDFGSGAPLSDVKLWPYQVQCLHCISPPLIRVHQYVAHTWRAN